MWFQIANTKGFTLVELITVLILVSIFAVVGGAKFFSNTSVSESRYHQDILTAVRYARKIAIASQCNVQVALTASSYALTYSGGYTGSCAGNVLHPNGQSAYSDSSVSVSITFSSATFVFDAAGKPTPETGGTISLGSKTITIEAETGYVHE